MTKLFDALNSPLLCEEFLDRLNAWCESGVWYEMRFNIKIDADGEVYISHQLLLRPEPDLIELKKRTQ